MYNSPVRQAPQIPSFINGRWLCRTGIHYALWHKRVRADAKIQDQWDVASHHTDLLQPSTRARALGLQILGRHAGSDNDGLGLESGYDSVDSLAWQPKLRNTRSHRIARPPIRFVLHSRL